MTHDELISLVKQPDLVGAEHIAALKELVDMYSYFAPARLFYTKALQISGSVFFETSLKQASIYSANRRWLYYYIHPDRKTSTEPYKKDRSTKSSGDYFDMMSVLESEGGDAKQTLRNLAERLKSARAMVTTKSTKPIKAPAEGLVVAENDISEADGIDIKPIATDYFVENDIEFTEANAKKLILEHKYSAAVEILKVINLNNPKKSVYFADQIRFLEKVIANSKK